MKKNKMITKGCPECAQQVPVACKNCPCGYSFFSARKGLNKATDDSTEIKCRRTERVKREKPDYYDPLEYDNRKRLKRRTLRQQKSAEDKDYVVGKPIEEEPKPGKKGRKRKVRAEREQKEEEEDVISNITPEKALKYSIILADINHKITTSSWRVAD